MVNPELDTQTKIVLAASHLFARHGIEAVPMRDIGQLAGQRNSSAVQYHFGGRWELVAAVLARHSETVTAGEGDLGDATAGEIVAGLVGLLRPKLADGDGRDFLRVVFELMVRYPGRWDNPVTHRGMSNLVDRLAELLAPLPAEVAAARAVAMTQFVTHQLAERARLIDDGGDLVLDEATFVANLTRMGAAMLTAEAPPAMQVVSKRRRSTAGSGRQ